MRITFSAKQSLASLNIILAENFDLDKHLSIDNNELKTYIAKAVQLRQFTGKLGQKASLLVPNNGQMQQIILLGAGLVVDFDSLAATKLGGGILSGMNCVKLTQTSVMLDERLIANHEANINAHLAYGASLRNYDFDKYKSSDKLKDKVIIEQIEFVTKCAKEAEALFIKELNPIVDAVHLSRNLVSEPPNVIYPAGFVEHVKADFAGLDIKIEVLGESEMHELGMMALLGVGQGSGRESKLLVMQYNGGEKNDAPLCFVGKGVTFDTGGISIKPATNMEDMKYDMAGAAAVTGLIRALATRKAKVNIVAVAGLVENMPDGNAQRPSDIVKSMSGQTIEILNTDAEGRLVLADALWYTQNRFKPKLMIDLATLTGAAIMALSTHNAALYSNNEELQQQLFAAGKATDEKLWPMPLSPEYDKMIDSTIADVRNTSTGKGGGSITAAQFLQRFVNEVKWAHLDIAGTAWGNKSCEIYPEGATGFGVRLLDNFVRNYEKSS